MAKKKLPIGIRSFETMIKDNYVYVDKTAHVYRLADSGMFYFLSRPPRFGKSLLVSTLQSLFEGKKDLFKGLWIENSDWNWKPHPVVKIDFNEIQLTDAGILEQSLLATLDQLAEPHAITLRQTLLANKFVELLTELHRKYQEKVVVLIDEYDKPIVAHLGKGEAGLQIAKENLDVLMRFWGVLKGGVVADLLRFVFVTGVTRFSMASAYSGLNNLQNLSMHSEYADLLGFTNGEVTHNFEDYILQLAAKTGTNLDDCLESLRAWYNGYRFSQKEAKVYNPFSILNALKSHSFKSFWFETATSRFVVNLIKERDYPIPNLENLEVQEMVFSTYELENLQLEALLFQTGYITIHEYDGVLYRLGYPNQEVKTSFLGHLYQSLVEMPNTQGSTLIATSIIVP